MQSWKRWMTTGMVGAALVTTSSWAFADVRMEGEWPTSAKKVSLHVENARKDVALGELAKQAGWNIVLHGDFTASFPVSLDLHDADAKDALESVLSEGSFVAKRKGTILEITALPVLAAAAESAAPAAPAAPVIPGVVASGKDRAVLGHDLRVEKGETVGDVSLTGGSGEIYGTVDGDLVVTGGSVTVHDGGHITGDALAIGGAIHVEKGGLVDGSHKVIGGVFVRDDEGTPRHDAAEEPKASLWVRTGRGISDVFGNFTFLFVVGALFFAVAPERMLRLRSAVAEKPVASVAYGIGGLLGSLAAVVVLCITVIGIPFALVGMLLAGVAVTGALSATVTTAGAALLGHRTQNHYVHLALGAAIFAVAGAIPWLGGWVQIGAVLAAMGVLVTTRVAGFVTRKAPAMPSSDQPYR